MKVVTDKSYLSVSLRFSLMLPEISLNAFKSNCARGLSRFLVLTSGIGGGVAGGESAPPKVFIW